jgi:3-dehydroquinate synthetase
MRIDKKAEGGEIRFVLIDGVGRASMRAASDALVREVLEATTSAEAARAFTPRDASGLGA